MSAPAPNPRFPVTTASTPRRARRIRTGPISGEEAAERRARVLRIATEEFLAEGFRGANLDVIAQRCRVSKVTIYRQYGNKEKLFLEVAGASVGDFQYGLEQKLKSDRPFEDMIRDIIELIVTSTSDQRTTGVLRLVIAERNNFPGIARLLLMQTNDIIQPLADYLRKMACEAMSNREAQHRAYHLMSIASGGFGILLGNPKSFYGNQRTWIEYAAQTFLQRFPAAK